jgi:hypothetical protein
MGEGVDGGGIRQFLARPGEGAPRRFRWGVRSGSASRAWGCACAGHDDDWR